jgi:hypothetical protein
MPLNIVETNLEKVKPELHALYVKQSDGKFKLALSDLDQHVENQLKPLKSDLEITREHERKLLLENGLGAALRQANLDPHYEKLVIANLDDRLAIETVNNKRVVRIKDGKGEMPMLGSGADGLATLGDLANEAAKAFPSAFSGAGGEMPSAPGADRTGRSGQKILTRTAFDALSPVDRAVKMKEGFTIAEPPPAKKAESRSIPGKTITLADWKISPIEKHAKIMKEGLKLVD